MATDRIINREELIWAAGFFDGEGTFNVLRYKRRDRPDRELKNLAFRVSIAQSIDPNTTADDCPEVLKRFRRAILNLGFLHKRKNYQYDNHNRKPQWTLDIQNFEESQAVFALLFQFLSPVKRNQGLLALKEVREYQNDARKGNYTVSNSNERQVLKALGFRR